MELILHLVFDYLLKIKNYSIEELTKLQPGARMKLMYPDDSNANAYKKICMRFIHLYGNDMIHAISKCNFTIEEVNTAINAYENLCTMINIELEVIALQERL